MSGSMLACYISLLSLGEVGFLFVFPPGVAPYDFPFLSRLKHISGAGILHMFLFKFIPSSFFYLWCRQVKMVSRVMKMRSNLKHVHLL